MGKVRVNQEADDIDGILSILEATKHPALTWVGKNYSKADLIRDLKKLSSNNEDNETLPSWCRIRA